MVAKGGIEPPIQGFSVQRYSVKNHTLVIRTYSAIIEI